MPRARRYRPSHDWRDPAMPVIRDYKMGDGSRREIVDPDYEAAFRAHMIEASEAPNWRNDPTYNLKRRRNPSRG